MIEVTGAATDMLSGDCPGASLIDLVLAACELSEDEWEIQDRVATALEREPCPAALVAPAPAP
jgi:hypothetical protein